MQKALIIFLLLLTSSFCKAQAKLEQLDLNNLISMSVHSVTALYSPNKQLKVENFDKTIDSLRTPTLNRIADALTAVWKADKSILEPRFLSRPSNNDLVLWYIIREINSNHNSNHKVTRPDSTIAKEILAKNIDERWLLDNYYTLIMDDMVNLFKTEDLSNYNFDLENLGLKNETEKGIFYLNMMEGIVSIRFQILTMMKKSEWILEHCNKLPMFNGKKYYYYKNFDYEDFNWIGNSDTAESYNLKRIGGLYNTLISQINVTGELSGQDAAKEIYFNSITYEPKYFKYALQSEFLQNMYEQSK